MSQVSVTLEVSFVDDGLPVFADLTMSGFKPLMDANLPEEERVGKAMELIKGDDKHRFELVAKLWEKYLAWGEGIDEVNESLYRIHFGAGSSGMDFAQDLAFMFASYRSVTRVVAKVWDMDAFYNEDTDTEYAMEFVIDKKSMWRKVDA
jgi:hypothetical protein